MRQEAIMYSYVSISTTAEGVEFAASHLMGESVGARLVQGKECSERELRKERDMRCLVEQKMANGEKELEEEKKKSGVVPEEADTLKKEKNAELKTETESREESSVEMKGKFGEMERKVVEARKDADAYGKGSEEAREKEGEIRRLTFAAESFRKAVKVIKK